MAPFFLFLKCDGKVIPDEGAAGFRDLIAAQHEALAILRTILADALLTEQELAIDAIVVADETGQELLEISFDKVLPESVKKQLASRVLSVP